MASLVLQARDREILDLLRDQGFASFEQIKKRFFPNKHVCSKRLGLLETNNYLCSRSIKEYFCENNQKVFFPYLLGIGLKSHTKIYYLDSVFRKLLPETNRLLKPDLCLHQLILTDMRFFLEKEITDARFFLSDPQVKILSEFQSGRRREFTPDISVEHRNYIMAVELERTKKSRNRYASRFSFYRDSSYTHVLYFYVNEGHLNMLLRLSGSSRKVGFAHFLRPNQVLTKAWGYLEIREWIAKVESIKPRSTL